mgnify:CR=1 FL=1
MTLPAEFFYQDAQTKEHCTEVPSGTIAIDQFLLSKPYWVSATLARDNKPKKLIISDWTAPY